MTYKAPSDARVRQQALDPAASFLVQAPAGSGKTELLTDRILALLAIVERPEQILAITFTRKAASEMHARVLSKLAAGEGPEPEAEHARASWLLAKKVLARDAERNWNLLAYPARLTIRTIDAFCAWLVRGMPWLSSLGGLPAMTDSADAHYQAAAQATLEMADDMPAVARLIAHLDVDLRAASELLSRMLASRDQWLPLLDSHDAQVLVDNLDQAIAKDVRQLSALMPLGWAGEIGKALAHAAQTLASTDDARLAALLDWDGSPLGTDADSLAAWQAVAHGVLTQKGELRGRLTKREGFDTQSPFKAPMMEWLKAQGNEQAWVRALSAIRDLPDGYQDEQLAMLEDLVQVLRLAAAQLTLRFADESEVDFIEVAQRALQALGSEAEPTDLMLAMDASIQHILVDEFQDTSHSQIELLRRLTAGWQQGDGRTLFLVGDPMQSIYRFRKAEVGWFLRIRQDGRLGHHALTPLALTDNFRSKGGVVEWVNTVFRPLLPAHSDPDLGAIQYSPSVAFHDALKEPSIHFHASWVGPEDTPEAVAARTETQVVECVRQALQRHEGAAKPVAILVRARSHLGEVVRALARHGIACRAVELVPLSQRQAVQDALQLVRALTHAGDRLAWLAVLRSPLCGLRLESLHALFGKSSVLAIPDAMRLWLAAEPSARAALAEDEAKRLAHGAAVLLDGANASGRLPFAAWVQQAWQRLGGEAVYGSDDDRADVEQLFRLLEAMAPYGNVDLDALEARVMRLFAASDEAGAGVEVMTIHKAKGLQYETVILMGLHRRPANDTAPLLRFEQTGESLLLGPIAHRASDAPDPVSRYLAQREKQRAAYEADRLLYVAVTRACQFLHLMAELTVDEHGLLKPPASSSLLGSLWPYVQHEFQAPVFAQSDVGGALAQTRSSARLLRRIALTHLPEARPFNPLPGGLNWQWQAEVTEDEAIIGTVAHAWLEHLGREGLDAWPQDRLRQAQGVMARQLSRAGVPPARVAEAGRIVLDTLLATLSSERGRWLLQVAQASREWSLLDASGRVSVIDLAISDERGWLVVDYKTGTPWPDESREAFAQRMRERHGEQLARYCTQVSALDGRPARAALYFPRADVWVDFG